MIKQFQTLIVDVGLIPSVLSISRSVERKVGFLGWLVEDSMVSDDGPMISMANP